MARAQHPPATVFAHEEACEMCDGAGWLVDESGRASRCMCLDRRAARARLRSLQAIVPQRFAGLDLDLGAEWTEALPPETVAAAREYARRIAQNVSSGRGLWIEGPPGTRQTALAMAVSARAIAEGVEVAIYSLPRLLGALRTVLDERSPRVGREDLLDRLTEIDLLQIDDLGQARRTDWAVEQLFVLVNERYQRRRALLVTSDCPPDELAECVGLGVVTRLREICGEPWHVGGGSAGGLRLSGRDVQ